VSVNYDKLRPLGQVRNKDRGGGGGGVFSEVQVSVTKFRSGLKRGGSVLVRGLTLPQKSELGDLLKA